MQVKYCSILDIPYGIICHQVNCQGVMGSGLAKSLYTKWPKVKSDYLEFVQHLKLTYGNSYRTALLLGKVVYTQVEDNLTVASIFGQDSYGRNKAIVYTDYDALDVGLRSVVREARLNNIGPVTVPFQIGCGLANGNWKDVVKRIERIELDESTIINVAKLN